jgi:hypothetical protein
MRFPHSARIANGDNSSDSFATLPRDAIRYYVQDGVIGLMAALGWGAVACATVDAAAVAATRKLQSPGGGGGTGTGTGTSGSGSGEDLSAPNFAWRQARIAAKKEASSGGGGDGGASSESVSTPLSIQNQKVSGSQNTSKQSPGDGNKSGHKHTGRAMPSAGAGAGADTSSSNSSDNGHTAGFIPQQMIWALAVVACGVIGFAMLNRSS